MAQVIAFMVVMRITNGDLLNVFDRTTFSRSETFADSSFFWRNADVWGAASTSVVWQSERWLEPRV